MYEDVFYSGAGKFVSQGEWIHPDRVISTYELIFVLHGTVCITEEKQVYHLKKNDLLLLEPGRRHFGHQASSNTSFFWVHFKSDSQWEFLLKQQNIPDASKFLWSKHPSARSKRWRNSFHWTILIEFLYGSNASLA